MGTEQETTKASAHSHVPLALNHRTRTRTPHQLRLYCDDMSLAFNMSRNTLCAFKSELNDEENNKTSETTSSLLSLGGICEILGALSIAVKKTDIQHKEEQNLLASRELALKKLQARCDQADRDFNLIRQGRMCPVCGATSYRTKNKPFTDGKQVMAHVRGTQDEAHTRFRQGITSNMVDHIAVSDFR